METYVAIDFDGTIVTNRFPEIGDLVPGAVKWIKRFKELGATLILVTMRSNGQRKGDVLDEAVEFCRSKGIEFDLVNENPQDWTTSPKIYAHVYIDDHNAGCPVQQEYDNSNRTGFQKIYVDWDKVGPEVERYLIYRKNKLI